MIFFSWTNFRTHFWPRGHVPRGWSPMKKKGLGKLIGLGIKILRIGPKLRELWPWPWQSKSPLHIPIQELIRLKMLSALSILEDFDCLGHNSLNVGPILKILVPTPISFPRPFFSIYWSTTWHVPMWPETCPKVGPCKLKVEKVENHGLVHIFQLIFLL